MPWLALGQSWYLFAQWIKYIKKKQIEIKTGKKINVIAVSAKNINKKETV